MGVVLLRATPRLAPQNESFASPFKISEGVFIFPATRARTVKFESFDSDINVSIDVLWFLATSLLIPISK